MSNPKISIIIPVYNTADYLQQCLDSVLIQSFRDIEIVIVNDASPDHSLHIIHDYHKKDGRIKVVDKPRNEGLAAARNSGVAVSTGDYVIHLDSDDFWIDATMLWHLYGIAVTEDCDILRFNGYNYEDGELTSKILNRLDLINGTFAEDRELWVYRSVYLYFFKKSFIETNNLSFVEGVDLGEDGVFLSSALTAAKKVSSTSNCYYAYRFNSASLMNREWTLDMFLEEETASRLITDNISSNSGALAQLLSYRMGQYWPLKLGVKARRFLSYHEREKLYEFVRENVLKLDPNLLNTIELHHMRAKIIHKYFAASDYKKIDRFIDGVNLLTVKSLFSPGFILWILSGVGWIYRHFITLIRYIKWFLFILSRPVFRLLSPVKHAVYSHVDREKAFRNIESLEEYNFVLSDRGHPAGASAMLRVKNEARRIRSCIDSIIDVFDEIVVIDNGSSDSTPDIVRSLLDSKEYADKIKLYSYPHRVARCGEEHIMTSADSVQSLPYYYNWCLSKCRYSVVCKWDADMLMSSDSRLKSTFKEFLQRFVHGRRFKLGEFPIQTVYYDRDNIPYKARDEINEEYRLFPNSSYVYFTKGPSWEVLTPAFYMPTQTLSDVCVYEIKDVADDEFSHWTTIKFKKSRKVAEYRNYMKVKHNLHKESPADFIPAGTLD